MYDVRIASSALHSAKDFCKIDLLFGSTEEVEEQVPDS